MQLPLGMRLTLRPFLLLLRDLVLLCRKRWGQITHRLWYIFGFLRSRFLSRCSERKDEIRPSAERRSAKSSPTTVICASQLPPQLTSIAGGDTPQVVIDESPAIPIAVRRPTIDNTPQEYHENNGADSPDVNDYKLSESEPISRSPDTAPRYDEPDPIEGAFSQNREESTSNSPVTPSRNNARPPSRSHRPASLHAEHHLGLPSEPQSSHRPLSESGYHSPPYQSSRPPSVTSSTSSRVYRASGPFTPVRTPHPITDAPRRRNRPHTPASTRQEVHEEPLDAPELREVVPQTSGFSHHDRSATARPRPSTTPPGGGLRPMLGINRYEKNRKVTIEETSEIHVLPPVTTEFAP